MITELGSDGTTTALPTSDASCWPLILHREDRAHSHISNNSDFGGLAMPERYFERSMNNATAVWEDQCPMVLRR